MKVAVHVFDGITTFHVAVPLEVFGEVSRLGLAADWEVAVWSEDGGPVRTAEGLVLTDLVGPEAAETADLLILPAWHADLRPPSARFTALIRSSHDRGAHVAGLCLGALPVAASGILDGRTAVTHWAGAVRLAELFPAVEVDADALYIDHDDVLTSAGTASALDACLHIVRSRLGSAAAARVARHLVIAPHREGGQAQYVERPLPAQQGGGPIGAVIEWALAHLDRPLTVAELADRAHMSTRSFTRGFRQVTGTSPARWVAARRLDEARTLLETTTWSIDRIARTCGFGSPVTFRQSFVREFGTAPTSYRRRFRAGPAHAAAQP